MEFSTALRKSATIRLLFRLKKITVFNQQVLIQQDDSNPLPFTQQQFELDYWRDKPDSQILRGGRGASIKFIRDNLNTEPEAFVLRRFVRGGLIAKLLKDRYLWTGVTHSRPYIERQVVQHAIQHELPVAEVVAYMVQLSGPFYRAGIISRYIENQGTLASYLMQQCLDDGHWNALGQLIAKMHQVGIYHSDLNANNLLIDADKNFHVIDFDKARIKTSGGDWQQQNIGRLLRSLKKIQRLQQQENKKFYFNDSKWQCLLSAYK